VVKPEINSGLETLLQLDGEVFPMDNGYWVKFAVHTTVKNEHIPHGIRYSLTLHDKYNRRVVGYDNAHGIKRPKKKKFSGVRKTWDHRHQESVVKPYEFESAYQLLEDFWNDVNAVIN
jgi:hypothetical protein